MARPDRRRRLPRVFISAIAAAGGLAAVVTVAVRGTGVAGTAVGFGVMIFAGELLRVQLPGDRDASPVGTAAALGYAFATPLSDHTVTDVIALSFVACAAAAIVYLALDRDPRVTDMARRLLSIALAATTFRLYLADHLAHWSVGSGDHRIPILAMVIAALIAGLADIVLSSALAAARDRAPYLPGLRNELMAQAGIGIAMSSTGILIALSLPRMHLWALLVFAVPLLVTQFSFRRYASITSTYRQTIRALSRVTEVAGYVEPGHSRRVMLLSVAVGREFGMTESDLLDLEYAALMHDIGQLSLSEPIPRGSTLTVTPSERRHIAEMGGAVVRETGNLDEVARIVTSVASPYRRMRESGDVDVPVAARIIKAVSAYDDLLTASREARGPRAVWDALERLRMGMAFEYDPRVIEAMTRVLAKSGAL